VGWLEANLVPPQSRQLDVLAQEAAGLRCQPGEFRPLGLGDQQVGPTQLRQPTHMILVQVGRIAVSTSAGA
jgi:hypothetical protein